MTPARLSLIMTPPERMLTELGNSEEVERAFDPIVSLIQLDILSTHSYSEALTPD
jgi:hypothetical protein